MVLGWVREGRGGKDKYIMDLFSVFDFGWGGAYITTVYMYIYIYIYVTFTVSEAILKASGPGPRVDTTNL